MRSTAIATSLTGTGTLVRFLLRKDRLKLPGWVAGLGLFVVYIGAALPQLAPTQQDLRSMATLFTQPVGRMFTGPAIGMDVPTYERFFAAGYAPYLFILAALMSILLVTRHTRGEEQSGRAELLRANVTGRFAALTAGLVVAAISNGFAAVVVGGMAIAAGFDPHGSALIGISTGLTGMTFAGITAVTVQLSENARVAAGMAGAVLGASFVVRALGDMAAIGGSALSWFSPLAWSAQTAPYVHDSWAPLLLHLTLMAVAITAAFVLHGRRDFGASFIAARRGPHQAAASLGTARGLAVRLQRGGFFGWGAGILLLGVVNGAFTQALIDAGADMPDALQEMLGSGGLVDGYVAFLGSFVSVLIAAYTVSAMQTVRREEVVGRAEAVLATAVGRIGWLGSHMAAIAVGGLLISVATGLSTGVAAMAVTGDVNVFGDVVAAHLGLVPAVVLVLAVCAALLGCAPRLFVPVAWALVSFVGVVAFFSSLLDLPSWLVSLSPFSHLAQLPLEPFQMVPVLTVCAAAVFTTAVGFVGIQRRQVNAG